MNAMAPFLTRNLKKKTKRVITPCTSAPGLLRSVIHVILDSNVTLL